MAVTFGEALRDLMRSETNQNMKKIKLVNDEILNGSIVSVNADIIEVSLVCEGAGRAKLTVPLSSILYISDVEL